MKQTSQEVMINAEVSPIVKEAEHLNIIDSKSMSLATEFLSQLNKENDRLSADRETLTKPINEALRNINARYKPKTDLLKKAIETIRSKMGTYQMALIKKQREEEAKIEARIGEGKGKIRFETAAKKMAEVSVPDEKVSTESGSVSFMTVYEVEILSLKDIPLEYMLPDESAILKDLKSGKPIPGTKLLEKLVPKNSRGR